MIGHAIRAIPRVAAPALILPLLAASLGVLATPQATRAVVAAPPYQLTADFSPATDGDADGGGTAAIAVDEADPGFTGQVCVTWALTNIDAATSAVLVDAAASLEVTLFTPDASGTGTGCTSGVLAATLHTIAARPADWSVVVKNATYPNGAVAGGLVFASPTTWIDVRDWLCPSTIQSLGDLARIGAQACKGTALFTPAPPAGYTWSNWGGTSTFAWEVFPYGPSPALAWGDAALDKWEVANCDTVAKTCPLGALPYAFQAAAQGPTFVVETTPPAGYHVGYISGEMLTSDWVDASPVMTTDMTFPGVLVDTTGASMLSLDVYHFLGPQPTDATYVPMTPARLLDSRSGNGMPSSAPAKFANKVARTIQIAGRKGVPVDAVAVTGNLTIVGETAKGFLSVGPVKDNAPTTSTLNFPAGDTRANNVNVALDLNGALSIVYVATPGATADVLFDVTGYFLADGDQATFEPLAAPARLVDTRSTSPIGQNASRQFQITSATGVVPTGALAIVANLTVVKPTGKGYVSLAPTFTSLPPATSAINFPAGDVRANGVTVPLTVAGKLTAYFGSPVAGSKCNILIDVIGYYKTGTDGLDFVPTNPTRMLDTRYGIGLSGPFTAQTGRAVQVSGRGYVEFDAEAISGNVTVTGQTTAGYVSVTPTIVAYPPATSTLNFPLGDTRANGTSVSLSGAGKIAAVFGAATGTTQVIFDINGFYRQNIPSTAAARAAASMWSKFAALKAQLERR